MNDKQLSFIDLLSIASFVIGLQNLDLNVTQEDAQNLMNSIDEKTNTILNEIHKHLEMQDKKLTEILEIIEVIK